MRQVSTPLIEALLAIIEASRAYLPPDGIGKDELIAQCWRRPTIRALSPLSPLWSSSGGGKEVNRLRREQGSCAR